MKNNYIKTLATLITLTATFVTADAQLSRLRSDPVGNYIGVMHPKKHPNPFSGTFVVSGYFSFNLNLSSTGIREGTGTGTFLIGGRRTNAQELTVVAPTLTLDPVNNTVIRNDDGNIDFYMSFSKSFPKLSGESVFQVTGTLNKVPSSTKSIYFRRVTHQTNTAELISTESRPVISSTNSAVIETEISNPSAVVVEASGGRGNLALDRFKISRTRSSSNKSFFKT